MDAKVEQAVQQALGSTRPMLEKLDTVTGILCQNGLAWKTTCKVQEVLVHPQNRGGQMLSVEDVHSKGAKLLQVGIKKDLLSGSVCFAIGHSDDVKKRQLLTNQQLAEGHPELLAPVVGNDRYLAVLTLPASSVLLLPARLRRPVLSWFIISRRPCGIFWTTGGSGR